MSTIRSIAIGTTLVFGAAAQAQTILRAMSDNRSGNVSAFANAPSGDPREAGFNVDPGQNDFDPFDFFLSETDLRQGCSATRANATVDHVSDFPLLDNQQRCRGFRATHIASDAVTVTSCGTGSTTSAAFEGNLNVVIRIENAPSNGTPIRVRGTAASSGGATALARITRPNGTSLLNLTNGAVNAVVNLPNGDYTIQCNTGNSFVSRSTVGSTAKSAAFSVGFWKDCQGDLTGDGQIGLEDLTALLSAFGVSVLGDVDNDGLTDLSDLTLLLSRFGASCSN